MWQKSENSELSQPSELETYRDIVIVRQNFEFVEAETEEQDGETIILMPAHWKYDEWQMTSDQYEVWLIQQADVDFLSMENDFLVEENEQQQADIDFLLMMVEE